MLQALETFLAADSHLTKFAFLVTFLIFAVAMGRFFIRLHNNDNSPFRIEAYLTDSEGRPSKVALAFICSFFATTWIVIYLTVVDKMDIAYFSAYCATWVAPILTRIVATEKKE